MQWSECSPVTFHPQKVLKTESSGVDEQSVHSEPHDDVLGVRFMDVETLLGRLNVDNLSRHQLLPRED